MRLLSVDWDFFTPELAEGPDACLFDWGHREGHPLESFLWTIRAAAFVRAGKPLPGTSGEDVGFWDRFRFQPGTVCYVDDSHSQIFDPKVRNGVRAIVSYDAHHDAGYTRDADELRARGRVSCEDWALAYHVLDGVGTRVLYPRWKTWAFEAEHRAQADVDRAFDDGQPDPVPFDRVFVCRSGAWAPPWNDDALEALLAAFPGRVIRFPGLTPRTFDPAQAELIARAERRLTQVGEFVSTYPMTEPAVLAKAEADARAVLGGPLPGEAVA